MKIEKKSYKDQLNHLEYLARSKGFRIEKYFSKEGLIFRIYGDSKVKVNSFMKSYYYLLF